MNREIKYRDCIVSQVSNNHVAIFKDGKMVFHAQINKRLTNDELKKQVDFYLNVLLPIIDESEVKNAK